ncbi:unnamed protein product [Discula destructiva]
MQTGFETDIEAVPLNQYMVGKADGQHAGVRESIRAVGFGGGAAAALKNHAQRYHKDSLNRYIDLDKDPNNDQDHYLRPTDGKLGVVRVQIAPGSAVSNRTGTRRTWTASSFDSSNGIRDIPIGILKWTYRDAVESRTRDSSQLWWKYPIASFGLLFTAWLGNYNPKSNYAGRYPPVRYRYYRYAKLPRNRTEVIPGSHPVDDTRLQPGAGVVRGQDGRTEEEDGVLARHLRPRQLCVITSCDDANVGLGHFDYKVRETDEWDRERPSGQSGEYVFVSYTREQFQTYSAADIASWDAPQDAHEAAVRDGMPGLYQGDLDQLCTIGAVAARKAGLHAFWIDILCIPKAKKGSAGLNAQDSHRICDVARGANRMVIAVKDLVSDRITVPKSLATTEKELLQRWASRLWTLPEMLLAPTVHDLEVYRATRNENGRVRSWTTIPKRNMAEIAYPDDGERVRELVDHVEASVHLTQIELLTLGLECLVGRKMNKYSQADMVYALMTLARLRPLPYQGQSLFEAFAQLSLLNDSNMLLERLMCVLPPGPRGEVPWFRIRDAWGVRLWDIFPTCQVSGIAGGDADQTVLIDGAYGASIEWRRLKKVEFLKRRTAWRTAGELAAQAALVWLITAIVSIAVIEGVYNASSVEYSGSYYKRSSYGGTSSLIALPIVFFILAFAAMAVLPYAMFSKYRGKFWSTQAVLFGLEGMPDIDWLERQLFGFSEGRLTWSPHGSTLSQHRMKEGSGEVLEGECEALKPLLEDDKQRDLSQADGERGDDMRVFTLVDTYAMTVTAFRASHPPTVALVLGHEGGMRRAALCSYNHKTQTFHRETVVRMPTKVLDRMDRVDRFRFSLESQPL